MSKRRPRPGVLAKVRNLYLRPACGEGLFAQTADFVEANVRAGGDDQRPAVGGKGGGWIRAIRGEIGEHGDSDSGSLGIKLNLDTANSSPQENTEVNGPSEMGRWGEVIDPHNDCKISAEVNKLSITVPGTRHDLVRRDG